MILISVRTKTRMDDRHDFSRRNRKNLDVKKYEENIAKIDWSEVYLTNNVDVINDKIVTEVLKVLDEAAPLKNFQRRKKFQNWVTQEMQDKMENRDELRRIARHSGTDVDWAAYKVARNKCVKDLSKCKTDYYKKLYEHIEQEKDTKGLFRLMKELFDNKDGLAPQAFLDEGHLVRKSREMANLQMNYYTEKVQLLMNNIPVSNRKPSQVFGTRARILGGEGPTATF